MRQLTLPIVIEGDADGYFVSCPFLQGCYSQGDTYEEAVENIKDAIRLHLQDRIASGEEIPEHVSVSLTTVEVAFDASAASPHRSPDHYRAGKSWLLAGASKRQSHDL
jgi:predicted RNase H-like HicB family nuclease